MANVRDHFSDEGLMCLHRIFEKGYSTSKGGALGRKLWKTAKEIEAELLFRVPISHLCKIVKLQRDLNLKTND
jgi:hypothetical protein